MKISNLVVSAFVMSVLMSCGGEQKSAEAELETPIDQPTEAVAVSSGKYQIKSGIITFDQESMGTHAKKVVYFDDFGAKERVERYNEDGTVSEVNISDGKKRYTLIPADKQAYFVDENGNRGWEMEFTPWEKIQQQTNYQENYAQAPNMTVAGKDCESFVYGGKTTFAGWQGLTLYHKQGELVTIKATSLEENASIGLDKFTVPADYKEVKLR